MIARRIDGYISQFPADVQAILEMVRVTSNLRRLGDLAGKVAKDIIA
jgi:hypothetical protein